MNGFWAMPLTGRVANGVAQNPGSPWIGLCVGAVVALIGAFAATDFMRLPSKMHERMSRYAPDGRKGKFTTSFEYQRGIGLLLVLAGVVTIGLSLARFM
jgi:hypothetical protein